MPSVFLDTNVLVYAATAEKTHPAHWKAAMEILDRNDCVISAQVMAEFVSVVRRKASPPLSDGEMDEWLAALEALDPLPVDAGIVRRGATISAEHGLNYYDGAILAAAERLGCDTVLSEDMTDGRAYGGVTVRNPFAEARP